MASSIDATKPTAGAALTADVRNNFSAAKTEIEALQAAVASALVAKAGDTMTGALNWSATQTIASATTTDIGAATSNSVIVSGTTTITGLGTIAAGAERVVQFSGALTLTHNATSLILPGGASITTAAGDVASFVSLGAGNWRCTGYQKASGQAVVASGTSSDTHLLYNSGGAVVGNAALRAKVTTGAGNFTNSAPRLYIGQTGSCVALSYQSAYGGLVVVNEAATSTASLYASLLSSDYVASANYVQVTNGGYIAANGWETYHGMRVRSDGHFAFSSTTSATGAPDVALKRDAANRASVFIPGASYGDLKLRSLISSGGTITLSNYTVATLPTAASNAHAIVAVTDGNASPTYRGAVTGGGSTKGVVYCDGSSWMWH